MPFLIFLALTFGHGRGLPGPALVPSGGACQVNVVCGCPVVTGPNRFARHTDYVPCVNRF